jgi:DNA-binding beta-propeller fold protein YncE
MRAAAALVVILPWLGAGAFVLSGAAPAGGFAPRGVSSSSGPALAIWSNVSGGIAVGPEGDIFVADAYNGVIRRIYEETLLVSPFAGNQALGSGFSGDGGHATAAMLNAPDGIAIAADGDLIIADAENHRIRRVDVQTANISTIAGSGVPGFAGDGGPATEAQIFQPAAVAVEEDGDIYIADTMNNRIRRIDAETGTISTVAGDGRVVETEGAPVGDWGLATSAHLYMPSDVAVTPEGHLYIADMYHNRVRRVDAWTQVITTVVGTGKWGNAPDSVPATEALFGGPAGLTVVPGEEGADPTLYVSDLYNGRVRVVGPDGVMRVVGKGSGVLFMSPTRLAYAPVRGWLYVADMGEDRIVALSLPAAP